MTRLRLVLGAAMLVLGGLVLARSIRYSSRSDLASVGGVHVSVEQQKPIPAWVGGVIALLGLGVVMSAASKRR